MCLILQHNKFIQNYRHPEDYLNTAKVNFGETAV